jgi:ketosteroid isomerase-like protein
MAAAPTAVARPVVTRPVVAAPVAAAPVAAAPAPVAVKGKDETDAVYEVVVAWAKAWGRKDVNAYLNMYTSTFKPSTGESHKAWAAERRDRIEGKRRIAVSLESPTLEVKGEMATVKFRQVYEADNLSSNSRKTLKLSKTEGAWKIVEETTGK